MAPIEVSRRASGAGWVVLRGFAAASPTCGHRALLTICHVFFLAMWRLRTLRELSRGDIFCLVYRLLLLTPPGAIAFESCSSTLVQLGRHRAPNNDQTKQDARRC